MTANPRPRTLSLGLVRAVVFVVCVGGIAGMIVGSIADNNGTAITFGLITAVAAIGLMLVSAVTPPEAPRRDVDSDPAEPHMGTELEAKVQRLIADGADESRVRDLVRHAVRVGRTLD
jgi:hypothetical protein